MKALAIETSGRIGSVALVEDAQVVAEEAFAHGLRHAAAVVPMIDRLCRQRGCRAKDVGEVYVSAGPGSFTGLRIGVTLAKTLCFSTGARLVAVPTVRVLAENAPAEARHLIIVLDAKRDQIFTARFESWGESAVSSGQLAEIDAADCRPPTAWIEREPAHLDSLAAMLERSPRPVYMLGEGVPYHERFIPKDDAGVIVTSEDTWRARASAVARLGIEMSRQGEFADPFELTPIYIRRPEAEEKRLGEST